MIELKVKLLETRILRFSNLNSIDDPEIIVISDYQECVDKLAITEGVKAFYKTYGWVTKETPHNNFIKTRSG